MNRLKRIICLFLAMVLLSSSVPMQASAANDVKYGVAYVNAKELRLRNNPRTSSRILGTATTAEVVVVVSKHDDWYKVIYNLKEGYMHEDFLIVKTAADTELGYGKVDGSSVNVRSGPGTSHSSVTKVSDGKKVYIIGINDGWYKVIANDQIGYIRSDYIKLTEVPYENKDSKNDPLFFRNGKSLGVKPSAEALKGETSSNSSNKTDTKKEEDKQSNKKEEKEETSSSTTSIPGVKYGIAFTTGSGLRLRSEASTKGNTLASASKGEVVLVLSKDGDWCKVSYNNKVGYMHADYLKIQKEGNAELGYGKINGNDVNVRSDAGTKYGSVTQGDKGDKAYVIGIKDGWYRIIFNGKIGYIRSDFLDLTEIPYENSASSKSPKFYRGGKSTGTEPSASALQGTSSNSSNKDKDTSTTEVSSSPLGTKIVDKAKQYLGVPYKWGGTSPSGFDCSGFVYYVLRSLGVNASRTLVTMYKQGKEVSKSKLEPGDIVFFQNTYKSGVSHVGIYVGNGQFIHAPSSGKVVSFADLHSDYYTSHYYGAVRFSK